MSRYHDRYHDFDFAESQKTAETQAGGFIRGVASAIVNAQIPKWFGRSLDWMREATPEDIHNVTGKLDLHDARILNRFIEIVRTEFPNHEA